MKFYPSLKKPATDMKSKSQPNYKSLLSFAYHTSKHLEETIQGGLDGVDIMIDSGAFTKHKSPKKVKHVTLENYLKFLKEVEDLKSKHNFTGEIHYVNLDVIGNAVETNKNLKIIESHGFKPLPVFTYSDSMENLKKLYDKYDWVLLGNVGGKNLRKLVGFFKTIIKSMGKESFRKFHILGISRLPLFAEIKPKSFDNSSFNRHNIAYHRAMNSPFNMKMVIKDFRQNGKYPDYLNNVRSMKKVFDFYSPKAINTMVKMISERYKTLDKSQQYFGALSILFCIVIMKVFKRDYDTDFYVVENNIIYMQQKKLMYERLLTAFHSEMNIDNLKIIPTKYLS